jgi:HEAT repeat protein
MKKDLTGLDFVVRKNARGFDALGSRCVRLGLVAAMGASLALSMSDRPSAQQRFKEPAVKVTSVTTSGNVVSINADGSLNHAQTWQEPDGSFHVVLVNGEAAPGVRAQRVGNSIELVVPVRRGANVTVQPRGNRLDLVVTGGALNVENFPVEPRQERAQRGERAAAQESSAPSEQPTAERAQSPKAESKRRAESAAEAALSSPPPSTTYAPPPANAQPAGQSQQSAAPAGDAVALGSSQTANAPQEPSRPPTVAQPAAIQSSEAGGFDFVSFLFSLPSMLVLLCVALAGAAFVVMRRRRGSAGEVKAESETLTKAAVSESVAQEKAAQPFQTFKGDRRKSSVTVPFDRRTSGAGAEDEATRRGNELAAETNNGHHARAESKSTASASVPSVVFGSYRIDQEVARLIAGEPHSIEVLASRASDDRRAVETSLLKALRAHETDDDGRRRARQALEDYGFVARSCASLLLGSETFERVSSARALADMKSSQALSFLTEALYDPDPLVRNECVQSLGALGLPSAIGALLDVARRHQDVPAAILGPALTACSVESLELKWDSQAARHAYADSSSAEERGGNDVRMIVPAVERYEELPEFIEDESLSAALVRIESTDADSRATAAQQLAQFQVRRAVAALATAACEDEEAAVRSAAVNSLGVINHESVFAYVIVALADEAREVRAAAARALSRLSFDRADAYVRLAETADARTLREVARACVKASLAAQAVARLTSEGRRSRRSRSSRSASAAAKHRPSSRPSRATAT